MKKILLLFIVFILALTACSKKSEKITVVTTIHPIAEIIRNLVPDSVEVVCLVPPNQSPHTFSLSPSEQMKLENASAIFYVSDELDGWATKTNNKNKYCLINMLQGNYVLYFDGEHEHNESENENHDNKQIKDPHFWTDPIAVKSIIDTLSFTLIHILKDYKVEISQVGEKLIKFSIDLKILDTELKILLAPLENKPVFLYHPSFRYFLKRYGLNYMGAIEPAPGKEPTPNYITETINKIKSSNTKAIFSEPQLADKIAKMIAESAGVKLYMLDPIGGVEGRKTYFDLINYNAQVLVKAFE